MSTNTRMFKAKNALQIVGKALFLSEKRSAESKCTKLSVTLLFVLMGHLAFSNPQKATVVKDVLGNHNDKEICLYTLTNKHGNVLKVTNYGAKIVQISVPDRDGKVENVTMASDQLAAIVKGDPFGGATIGRFANRIANGRFTLDSVEYRLPQNNGPNTLHGGPNGWHCKVWNDSIIAKKTAVRFTCVSPDMEEGFPGTVNASVTYTWTDQNEIIIDYEATSDKKTVINLTNHAYFNLHGAGNGYIYDHQLTIRASAYTPLNANKIPTGEIRPVHGTPYDFSNPAIIGSRIGQTYDSAVFQGYDDNYILDNKEKVDVVAYDPESGRVLEVLTDQPAIQFYSGNSMAWKRALESGTKGVNTRSGFALETQHFPDSPNQKAFPTTVLIPGEKFRSRTIYRFSVRKEK